MQKSSVDILHNILFCVPQIKKRRFGNFIFWLTIPLTEKNQIHFSVCVLIIFIQSFLLLTYWREKLWCFVAFCEINLFNGETERETEPDDKWSAKTEHKDLTKTGWPPYWGRIGLSTLSMFRISYIIYKAWQCFLQGAETVLPPDSAQADTQHPQFGTTLSVTQDSHMLTYAGMAFPRLPANEELTSRRWECSKLSVSARKCPQPEREMLGSFVTRCLRVRRRKTDPDSFVRRYETHKPVHGAVRRHQGRGVKGWVIPLSLLKEGGLMDELSEEMWKRCRVGENIMGFPLDMISSPHVPIMQYS